MLSLIKSKVHLAWPPRQAVKHVAGPSQSHAVKTFVHEVLCLLVASYIPALSKASSTSLSVSSRPTWTLMLSEEDLGRRILLTVGLFPFLCVSASLGSVCLLFGSHQGGVCAWTVVLSILFLVPIFDIWFPQPLLWGQQIKSKNQLDVHIMFFFFYPSQEKAYMVIFSAEETRVAQNNKRELFKEYRKEAKPPN